MCLLVNVGQVMIYILDFPSFVRTEWPDILLCLHAGTLQLVENLQEMAKLRHSVAWCPAENTQQLWSHGVVPPAVLGLMMCTVSNMGLAQPG